MRRKKVEGITLDLTSIIEGDPCDIYALIEEAQAKALKEDAVPKDKKVSKEKKSLVISKLSREECHTIIKGLTSTCDDCSGTLYYALKDWNMLKLCYSCHRKKFMGLCDEMNQYLSEKGHISCNFCGKIRINPYEFHFDHVNMYSKTGSVGPMLYNGCSIDKIKEEIDKCQLLCVSCHAVVTHFEHRYGFIKAKKSKKTAAIDAMDKIYDEYMGEVYAFMKGLHGK